MRSKGQRGVTLIELIVMSTVLAIILGMVATAMVDGFRYQQQLEPKIQAVREVTIAANVISRDLESALQNSVRHQNYCYYDGNGNLTDSDSGSQLSAGSSPDPNTGFVAAPIHQPLHIWKITPAQLPPPFENMGGRTSVAHFLDPYPDPNDPNYPNELGSLYRHTHMYSVPDPNDPLGLNPPLPQVYTAKVLARDIRSFEFTVRDTAANPYTTTVPTTPVKEVEFRIAPGKMGGTLTYTTVLPPPPPDTSTP